MTEKTTFAKIFEALYPDRANSKTYVVIHTKDRELFEGKVKDVPDEMLEYDWLIRSINPQDGRDKLTSQEDFCMKFILDEGSGHYIGKPAGDKAAYWNDDWFDIID